MSDNAVWYSVSGGMITSSFILVGPNMLQDASSAAKHTTATIRPNRLANAANPLSVTKRPALLHTAS